MYCWEVNSLISLVFVVSSNLLFLSLLLSALAIATSYVYLFLECRVYQLNKTKGVFCVAVLAFSCCLFCDFPYFKSNRSCIFSDN